MTSAIASPLQVYVVMRGNSGESKKASKQKRAGDPLAKALIMRGVFHGQTYFMADRVF